MIGNRIIHLGIWERKMALKKMKDSLSEIWEKRDFDYSKTSRKENPRREKGVEAGELSLPLSLPPSPFCFVAFSWWELEFWRINEAANALLYCLSGEGPFHIRIRIRSSFRTQSGWAGKSDLTRPTLSMGWKRVRNFVPAFKSVGWGSTHTTYFNRLGLSRMSKCI